jgi:hypothetical protein
VSEQQEASMSMDTQITTKKGERKMCHERERGELVLYVCLSFSLCLLHVCFFALLFGSLIYMVRDDGLIVYSPVHVIRLTTRIAASFYPLDVYTDTKFYAIPLSFSSSSYTCKGGAGPGQGQERLYHQSHPLSLFISPHN